MKEKLKGEIMNNDKENKNWTRSKLTKKKLWNIYSEKYTPHIHKMKNSNLKVLK